MEKIIGLTKKEAIEYLVKETEFQIRIISEDNRIYVVTSGCCNDYSLENIKRINLRIINNIIVDAFVG